MHRTNTLPAILCQTAQENFKPALNLLERQFLFPYGFDMQSPAFFPRHVAVAVQEYPKWRVTGAESYLCFLCCLAFIFFLVFDSRSLLCRHVSSGALPVQQVACVCMANWGGSSSEFACTPHTYGALCDMIFHEHHQIQNASVEALKVVPLDSAWAVLLVSRIISIVHRRGVCLPALRAILALFLRGASTGGIPQGNGVAHHAARTLLQNVEKTAENIRF